MFFIQKYFSTFNLPSVTDNMDHSVGCHFVPQHQLDSADKDVALLVELQDHVVPGGVHHLHLLLHETGANNLQTIFDEIRFHCYRIKLD